jgi:acyl-CoA thioesterase-1
MPYYLKSLLVFLLINLSLPYALAGENSQSEQQTILIMGDSISAGFGIDKSQGWVALLESKLKPLATPYKIINASISGETTSGGANRIKPLLAKHNPSLVIIELGGNDGLRGSPIKMMKQNLDYMIKQSQNAGAEVLLLGMRIPPNYGKTYSDLFSRQYKQLALENNTLILPFLLNGIATQTGMMQADGIHPTAKAQPLMMEYVWSMIKP